MKVPEGTDRKFAEVEAACSKDKYARPLYAEPWLKDGNLYATDSTIAVRIPVEDTDQDTEGMVPTSILKAARKGLPKHVMLNGDATTIGADGTLSAPRGDTDITQFPNIDQLVREDAEDDFVIGVDVLKLAQTAKALGADKVLLRFARDGGQLKPIVVKPVGRTDRIGLVMPIRLSMGR